MVGCAALTLVLPSCDGTEGSAALTSDTVRIALFNVRELSLAKLNEVDARGVGTNPQLLAAAEIVRRVAPDVLILNEVDHGPDPDELDLPARLFRDRYIEGEDISLQLRFSFAAPNNTGRLSGMDLDKDGKVATPADIGTREYGNDSWGYGEYPGQYSMAVLSKYPFQDDIARTFQRFLWRDLPANHLPTDWYAPETAQRLRLSSKSHQDVAIRIGETRLHLLLSHPTPPVFDGDEDRNGRRNFDEIGFWALYLNDDARLTDDKGNAGGLPEDHPFVIVGDLNAQPAADQAVYEGMPAISQLLGHPRVQETGPHLTSLGAPGDRAPGAPDFWERGTADFGDGARVDYLLPGSGLQVVDGGVFWPAETSDPPSHRMALQASDHRMIWLDLVVPLR